MTLPKKPPTTKRRGPHPHKALSAAFCRNVAEVGDYADGNGLYLRVGPSGTRRWVQRLVIRGRSRGLGLGSYALVTLAEAREQALANRKLARAGGDPIAAKRRSQGVPTFEEAAKQAIDLDSKGWRKGGKTKRQWLASMRDHVFPHLGDKTVDEVTTADIMDTLAPIWAPKHVTAKKVRQRIGRVMRWAIAQGYRQDNPAGDVVTAALPKRPARVRHRRSLPHREVAAAVAAARDADAWVGTKLAFEFLVLTVARSKEVRLATWGEIDLVKRVWTVPAIRMKGDEEHEVPLCDRAVEVLREAKQLRRVSTPPADDELVFTTVRGKVIDSAEISKLVRGLNLNAVPHGFRSSFRDWAGECTNYRREVMEAALAHTVGSETERAYARSTFFELRCQLMAEWGEYVQKV